MMSESTFTKISRPFVKTSFQHQTTQQWKIISSVQWIVFLGCIGVVYDFSRYEVEEGEGSWSLSDEDDEGDRRLRGGMCITLLLWRKGIGIVSRW